MLVLLAAGPVCAGEVEIGGEVTVGFGWLKQKSESPETAALDAVGEAEIDFSAEQGPFSATLALGIAESADELDTAEYDLAWAITDSIRLIVSGRSAGIEPFDGNISVINGPTGQVGDEEVFFDYSETGLVNVEFTAGTITMGIGISDACVPDCGFGHFRNADDETVNLSPDAETMSLILHIRKDRGEAEGLSFNAYAAASQGSFANTPDNRLLKGRGRGGGLGLSYKSGSLELGLDASRATVECNPGAIAKDDAAAALPSPCTADREIGEYGALVVAWGFGAHYYRAQDDAGAAREIVTNVDVVYLFQIEDATLGPEYRVTTTEQTGTPAATDSFLLFAMALEF